ncbi:MAG: prolipoprotein diacylglyceryl transferase, partial [Syntrophales bacterium]|nr:prolipoprotein diacylglyceryl transferase [Syntrophales bacterium]
PMLPTLAAMAIGHIMGEGTGRLACISFGCCYGKPLSVLPLLARKVLGPFAMTFYGATKKIAYAHGLDGQPVVPVQAMTAVIYTLAGLAGMWFFLTGLYLPAFAVTVGTAQGWRFLSEFLRADYRGGGRISPYQFMSLLALPYAGGLLFFFPSLPPPGGTQLMAGLESMWTPGMILFLQILWLLIFLYTGRSRVTGAEISLSVIRDRV